MGNDNARTRTLKRALEIAGTPDRLAARLGCDLPMLQEWLDGYKPIPTEIYLRALDVVAGRSRR